MNKLKAPILDYLFMGTEIERARRAAEGFTGKSS